MTDKNIEHLLDLANQAYEQGREQMSDAEYDALAAQVGKDADVSQYAEGEVPLPFYMASLSKNYNFNFEEIFESNTVLAVTEKLDGCSVCLYNDGHETKLITRGNGYKGQDCSHILGLVNMSHLRLIMDALPGCAVRGEIILPTSEWEHINTNSEYKHARGFVAGMLNSKAIPEQFADVKLDFVAYDIQYDEFDRDHATYPQMLAKLKSLGFDIPFMVQDSIDSIPAFEYFQNQVNHEIDGLVAIPANKTLKSLEAKGRDGKGNPNWMHAFKPNLDGSIIAEVTGLRVNTYNLHRASLVLELKSQFLKQNGIELSHVTIPAAVAETLHVGALIRLSMSGGIIPTYHSTIDEGSGEALRVDDTCSICGHKIIRDGDLYYCENPLCLGKLSARLDSFFTTLLGDKVGVGARTFFNILSAGATLQMFFEEDWSELYEKYETDLNFAKFTLKVDRLKLSPREAFCKCLEGLSLPCLGPTKVDALYTMCKEFSETPKLTDLINIPDEKYPDTKAWYTICQNFKNDDYRYLLHLTEKFAEQHTVQDKKYPIEIIPGVIDPKIHPLCVVTGELFIDGQQITRDVVCAVLKEAGFDISNTVLKRTSCYCLCDDENTTTVKAEDSRFYGYPVISYDKVFKKRA